MARRQSFFAQGLERTVLGKPVELGGGLTVVPQEIRHTATEVVLVSRDPDDDNRKVYTYLRPSDWVSIY